MEAKGQCISVVLKKAKENMKKVYSILRHFKAKERGVVRIART